MRKPVVQGLDDFISGYGVRFLISGIQCPGKCPDGHRMSTAMVLYTEWWDAL